LGRALLQHLGDQDYLMGSFSIADAALFYLTHWAAPFGIETPDNLSRFYARMKDRPAVQRVFAREQAAAA
jgi:glutathione S-transferase